MIILVMPFHCDTYLYAAIIIDNGRLSCNMYQNEGFKVAELIKLSHYSHSIDHFTGFRRYDTIWHGITCMTQHRSESGIPLEIDSKTKLLTVVKRINERQSACKSINIANPGEDVDVFISENQSEFQALNWSLIKGPFESTFHSRYKPTDNTLRIVKM